MLKEEIAYLRRPVSQLNQQFFFRVIDKIGMREELDAKQVIPYLQSMEPFFWQMVKQYQQQKTFTDVYAFMEASEEVFEMMLFGIVKVQLRNVKR